ncbi:MAG: autotransporter outer membrane beta-barrel domain-containing protein [Opitutaceae bacterium]|nr:autotransporter outer membrane beta-barrel domain-containing protein [Opitutaceae bacterium]
MHAELVTSNQLIVTKVSGTGAAGSVFLEIADGFTYTYQGIASGAVNGGAAEFSTVSGPGVSFVVMPASPGGTGKVRFFGNSARYGGALSVSGAGATFATGTLVNVQFGDINDANSGNHAVFTGGGGALYTTRVQDFLIQDSGVYRNTSSRSADGGGGNGGAMHLGAGSHVIIKNSQFGSETNPESGNSTTDAQGGAIYINGAAATTISTLDIADSGFYYNHADAGSLAYAANGGAISIGTFVDLTVRDSVFAGNYTVGATNSVYYGGGAFYSNAVSVTTAFVDTIFQDNHTSRLGGAIYHGSGVLTLEATKDITMSGNWSGSGGVTGTTPHYASGGFLYLGNAATAMANIKVAAGATMTIGSATLSSDYDSIASTGAAPTITVNGGGDTGTLLLHANNSGFSGTFNVNGGRVLLGNPDASLGGVVRVGNGGTLGGVGTVIPSAAKLDVMGGGVLQAGLGDGSSDGTLAVNGTVAFSNNGGLAGSGTIVAAAYYLGAADTNQIVAAIAGAGDILHLTGTIYGGGWLQKTGSGALVLDGASTMTGGVRLESGVLMLGHNAALGTGTLSVTGSDSRVVLGAAGMTITNAMLLMGKTAIDTNTYDGAFAAAISGAGTFEKTGMGRLTLADTSAFTGTAAISGGELAGNLAAASAVIISNNAVYDGNLTLGSGRIVGASGTIRGNLALAEGAIWSVDLGNSDGAPGTYDHLYLTGSLITAVSNTIDLRNIGSASSYIIASAGDLSGAPIGQFSLTAGGTPTNRISPRLAYAGNDIQLSTGARNLRVTWADGAADWDSSAANWTESSGETRFRSGDSVVFDITAGSSAVTVTAAGVAAGDLAVTVADGATLSFANGGIETDAAFADADGHAAGNDGYIYLGSSSAAATGRLVKTGAGTLLFLNGTNNFKGGIELREGVLAVTGSSQLGDGGQGVAFAGNATLATPGADVTLANNFSVAADKTAVFDTGTATLRLTGALAAPASGTFSKLGTGDLRLAANSAGHAGATWVREGRLLLDGGAANLGGGAVTVEPAAMFGGAGTAGRVLVKNGAFLSAGRPGAIATETLDISSTLTLEAGAQINFAIQSGDADHALSVNTKLNASGLLVTGGTAGDITLNFDRLYTGVYNIGNITGLKGAKILYAGQVVEMGGRQSIVYDDTTAAGSLLLNVTLSSSEKLVWRGNTGAQWNVSAQNWLVQGTGTAIVFGDGDTIIFDSVSDAANAGNRAITIEGMQVTLSDLLVEGGADYTFAGALIRTDSTSVMGGHVTGAQGRFEKTGAGTVTLANAGNVFTGGVMLSGGALVFSNGSQLVTTGTDGADAGIAISNSAVLRAGADGIGFDNKLLVAAGEAAGFDTNGMTATYSGTFDSGFAGELAVTGSGTLRLAAASASASGTLAINSAQVLLAAPDATLGNAVTVGGGGVFGGLGMATGNIAVGPGGTLRVGTDGTPALLTVGAASLSGGAAIAGSGTLAGALLLGGAGDVITAFINANDTLVISATTSGGGILAKSGSGALTLSGTAALGHAGTRIDEGVVWLRNITPAEAPDATHHFYINGGWLDLSDLAADADNVPVNDWQNLSFSGSLGGIIGADDQVTLAAGDTGFQIGSTGENGRGVFVVVAAGSGTASLAGNNTYAGYTRVDSGVLDVAAAASLGDTALSRNIILNGGGLHITGSFATSRALELRRDGTVDVDENLVSTWGSVTGSGALIKDGGGTLMLTGAPVVAHTGAKYVNAGILRGTGAALSGVINNSAAVMLDQPEGESTFTGRITGGVVTKAGPGGVVITDSVVLDTAMINIERGTFKQNAGAMVSAGQSFNIFANGELALPAGGAIAAPLLRNEGVIKIGGAATGTAGQTLTIEGDYAGGGIIQLGLRGASGGMLAADRADKLAITGSASGITRVIFTQADTSGTLANQADSLPDNLITVAGGGGEFIQDGRVTFGVKDYVLLYDPATGTGGWAISMASEIPAVMAVDAAVITSSKAAFDALGQRLEALRLFGGKSVPAGFTLWSNGIWHQDRFKKTVYDGATSVTSGVQVGADYTDANKVFALGGFVDYIRSELDVSSEADSTATVRGFGAYARFAGKRNFFDVILRGSSGVYEIALPNTPSFDMDVTGFGVVVGTGWLAKVDRLDIEPQLQVSWSRNRVDTATDAHGRAYHVRPFESLSGRASVRFSRLFKTDGGRQYRPYARIGYTRDFRSETEMQVKTIGELIDYTNNLGRDLVTLNAGVTLYVSKRLNLWADVSAATGENTDGYSANLGAAFHW